MSSVIELASNLDEMSEFEPLPSGVYPAELQDVEIRFSEKVPQGYVYCQFRVDPEDFPADYDIGNAPEGLIVVYSRCALPTPENRRSVRPFRKFLESLGQNTTKAEFNTDEWLNARVQLTLSQNEYQGSQVNNVDNVAALPTV